MVDSLEGQALVNAVCEAISAYSDFLDAHGLIWDDNFYPPRMKASALVVTVDYGKPGEYVFKLKDGPIDRVYGNGTNPDPDGLVPRTYRASCNSRRACRHSADTDMLLRC